MKKLKKAKASPILTRFQIYAYPLDALLACLRMYHSAGHYPVPDRRRLEHVEPLDNVQRHL